MGGLTVETAQGNEHISTETTINHFESQVITHLTPFLVTIIQIKLTACTPLRTKITKKELLSSKNFKCKQSCPSYVQFRQCCTAPGGRGSVKICRLHVGQSSLRTLIESSRQERPSPKGICLWECLKSMTGHVAIKTANTNFTGRLPSEMACHEVG